MYDPQRLFGNLSDMFAIDTLYFVIIRQDINTATHGMSTSGFMETSTSADTIKEAIQIELLSCDNMHIHLSLSSRAYIY